MTTIPTEPNHTTGTGEHKASGPRGRYAWRLPGETLDLSRPVVMGILNLTPDSFSDGGRLDSMEAAFAHARRLWEEGAGILDVGGESTRPGADQVPVDEELRRILPFIQEASRSFPVPLSVDTRNSQVAREAMLSGAQIVNDVSGLKHDPLMAGVVAEAGAGLVVNHMRGTPVTMRERTHYEDVAGEVVRELQVSLALAEEGGVPRESVVVDPGIGFAKTGAQSLAVLRELARLAPLRRPILVGPSRKSFIWEITGNQTGERLSGTLAACILAYQQGARVFRVHDVAPVVQALDVTRAILGEESPGDQYRTGTS